MDGLSSVLEGHVVAIEVGWEKDFGIPVEALAGGEISDKTGRTIRVADVDDGRLLHGEGGAKQTWSTGVKRLGSR